ncbi:glyoxylate/hydroxypyruvate reductase A [Gillisia sp. M10.2A]|uniref:Glyoxylate/hydroxypyruvate reductase A n=1 Tax=Gillisia lutea TaxID=2909668 RepID=A0ABS9EI10_9FLAO|nr:glyoxylate/hydroxypyruvate reductase A [Gillisia lutea]MCF4101977.1 glyoxylate/hydroxypyruvate reductase A [Gillisia lutea]
MSVLVICPGKNPEEWVKELKNNHPGMNIYIYPEEHDKEEVEYVVSWKHPRGIFRNYPNLKVIASMGAGVDHITSDPEIPDNIAITRIVDEQLTRDMSTFVMALVLDHIRDLSQHFNNINWEPFYYKRPEEVSVGIMGMGVLGKAVAQTLVNNNFQVSGWSRTPVEVNNITTYHGKKQQEQFLNNTSVLICLLPLTQETENILNKELFEKLPQGAYVINVARGQHLVEHDLLEMLDNEHLSGASLDVFRTEPLPQEHAFWKHPKIKITPHIASITNPKSAAAQVAQNYERMTEDEPLLNKVERAKGY